MKIAVIQMAVKESVRENLYHAEQMIARAAKNDADLLILPEMFCCLYTNESFAAYAEVEDGEICRRMAESARSNQIFLVAGSMPEREGERIYNTSFVYNNRGERIARHRKVHLFDIDVEGGQTFAESDTFSSGNESTVFDTPFGRFGLCICFDMRFPELAMRMTLDGAQAILVPAAFNMTTGPAHWKTMFCQRAVDNQLYTVGAAPARDESGPYISYGNSIVCGPWGNIVNRAGKEETILYADLEWEENEKIRKQLPLLASRKPKIYQ
ncbi:carbon-nitrogen hydrolase family protein [Hominifimenecus sp. rT4P-3]|uniref:carbon-nitrogen hydrolase family protein n=1 Tax=Hominifimenecus sp. rT4P-3 TaxID=3242979 RepID=UPI003DA21D81